MATDCVEKVLFRRWLKVLRTAGSRFSQKIMLQNRNLKRDGDSPSSYRALDPGGSPSPLQPDPAIDHKRQLHVSLSLHHR